MGHAHIYSFAYTGEAARMYLMTAKETENGQFYHCMSAILYSAFTIEAYLNHLGIDSFHLWGKRDRLSPWKKLKRLAVPLNFQLEWASEPLTSFNSAFQFRNSVAHATTEEIDWPDILAGSDVKARIPDTEWQLTANLTDAERMVDNAHELVRLLHAKTGASVDPFLIHASGARWGP